MPRIPPGEIPDGPSGWPERFTSDDLIDFVIPVDEPTARWWLDRFVVDGLSLYPRDIAERLIRGLPGAPRCRYTVVSPSSDRVSVEMHVPDNATSHLWLSAQTLEFAPGREMFSDIIDIPPHAQGHGLAKTIMSNCFRLAEDLTLSRLRLHAMWVGAYAWLRYGFVPDLGDWEGDLKSRITERLLELKPRIRPAKFNAILRLLSGENPKLAWVVADDPTPVVVSGSAAPVTLGQALLADCGAKWYGSLSFEDKQATARFRTYVGIQS